MRKYLTTIKRTVTEVMQHKFPTHTYPLVVPLQMKSLQEIDLLIAHYK